MGEGAEAQGGMRVKAWQISTIGAQELLLIGWSFLNSVNSSLLEWKAKEAVSVSGNESGSVRATVIDWSSWSLV